MTHSDEGRAKGCGAEHGQRGARCCTRGGCATAMHGHWQRQQREKSVLPQPPRALCAPNPRGAGAAQRRGRAPRRAVRDAAPGGRARGCVGRGARRHAAARWPPGRKRLAGGCSTVQLRARGRTNWTTSATSVLHLRWNGFDHGATMRVRGQIARTSVAHVRVCESRPTPAAAAATGTAATATATATATAAAATATAAAATAAADDIKPRGCNTCQKCSTAVWPVACRLVLRPAPSPAATPRFRAAADIGGNGAGGGDGAHSTS